MTVLHVLTVATKWDDRLGKLLESCAKQRLPIQILGLNGPYPGNNYKYKLVRDHIQHLHSQDIVLFVDAYDVLVLKGEDHILSTYRSFNFPLIMGAETNLSSSRHRISEFPRPRRRSST